MIPKIIHYCWLSGDPYPEKIQHCLNSWKRHLPDYEFVLWDTNRFQLEKSIWVKEAFSVKKYAFAADYIRLYAVYNYGGIYLDSDVEVLKRFDDVLNLPYFIGNESFENRVEIAAFGAEKGTRWIKECLDYYENRHFIKQNGEYDDKVMPDVIYEILNPQYEFCNISSITEFRHDKNVLNILPKDWFCANVHLNKDDKIPSYIISQSTYCVHHFANSWMKINKIKLIILKILSKFNIHKNRKIEWR